MPRRSTNPNAKRMYQLRLDPKNPHDKELIEFLDNQNRWQMTMDYLLSSQIRDYGTADVFVGLTQQGVTKPATKSVTNDAPKSVASSSVEQSTVSVTPSSAQSVAPVQQPQPQSSVSFPNSFTPQSNQNGGQNLKQNNDAFRDLM